MSTSRHHGKVVPLCRRCRRHADSVVAYPGGDAYPFCHMCANDSIGSVGREYPLEAFYTPQNRRVVSFDPPDPAFDLYDPADESETSWISADNSRWPYSSVQLDQMV